MLIEEQVAEILMKNMLSISTAESCTGGLLSSLLTDIPGSSVYTTYNVITYANEIKHKILGVTNYTLNNFGAVSPECAKEMVTGLKRISNSDVCIVTTGIAGPGGGSVSKPVGLCYVGISYKNILKVFEIKLSSEIPRKEMKLLFARKALEYLKDCLELGDDLF